MEILLIIAVIGVAALYVSIEAGPDSPKLFEWYKEIDGAAALPNAYFVEEACVYWAGLVRILADAPGPYVIRGQYPNARFFSIETYHPDIPVDVLFDFQITPDAGSLNPFRGGNAYPPDGQNLFYTVQLVEVAGKNEIPDIKPGNFLYVTRQKGQRNDYYIFLYRVYWNRMGDDVEVPHGYTRRQWEKQGQKPLPEVITRESAGSSADPDLSLIRPEIAGTSRDAIIGRFRESRNYSELQRTQGEESSGCSWVAGNPKVGFGNSAVVYLLINLDDSHGEIAVCRFKVPTFPDTNRREIIDQNTQQTRYWSVCTHIPGTMTTIACLSDCDFVIDNDGYATIVFSAEDKRPANAKNWLPYGWDESNRRYGAIVFLRNLLPSADGFPESPYFYAEACRWLYPPESPEYLRCIYDQCAIARFTGAYHPEHYYCSTSEFEKHGSRWERGARKRTDDP